MKCNVFFNMKPQQVPYIQHYPSMAPGGHYPRQQYPVGQYPAQGPPQPAVHGSFDPGARFGTGATVNVPVSAKLPYFLFHYSCIYHGLCRIFIVSVVHTDSKGTGEFLGQAWWNGQAFYLSSPSQILVFRVAYAQTGTFLDAEWVKRSKCVFVLSNWKEKLGKQMMEIVEATAYTTLDVVSMAND